MTDTMDLLYNKKIEKKPVPIKIHLNIPYKLKDDIKKLYSIKWELKSKRWYIIDNTNNEAEQINKLIANYELNNVVKPKKYIKNSLKNKILNYNI